MMFGGPTDEPTSHEIIARAKARGVNFIDTADVYQKGRTEEVVGRAIRHDRDDWVLATVRQPAGRGPQRPGHVPQVDHPGRGRQPAPAGHRLPRHPVLPPRRLQRPAGEAVRAIGDLIRAGKLRYFGVSNFRGWRIAEAAHLADAEGIDRPVASQPLYNLVNRSAEAEQLPAAAAYGVGVVSYSPLARRAHGQVRARPAAGRTRARARTGDCWKRSGVRNRCASPAASATTSTPRASIPCNSRWAGCSTTGW